MDGTHKAANAAPVGEMNAVKLQVEQGDVIKHLQRRH